MNAPATICQPVLVLDQVIEPSRPSCRLTVVATYQVFYRHGFLDVYLPPGIQLAGVVGSQEFIGTSEAAMRHEAENLFNDLLQRISQQLTQEGKPHEFQPIIRLD